MNVGYEINLITIHTLQEMIQLSLVELMDLQKLIFPNRIHKKFLYLAVAEKLRSWDGGYTFPLDSIHSSCKFYPIALADFDDEVMFGFDEELDFCKNGGVVDTSYVISDIYSKMLL